MVSRAMGQELPVMIVPDGALGPTRASVLIELMDRIRHDREFGNSFRREPVKTASAMDISLTDAEWAGIRHFLTD